jgi:hypothetical protein
LTEAAAGRAAITRWRSGWTTKAAAGVAAAAKCRWTTEATLRWTAEAAASGRRSIAAIEHHRAAFFRRRCSARRTHSLRHDVDAAFVDEPNHERAALHDIAVTECLLLNALIVEVRAVRAAEILDDEATVL